MSNRIYAWFVQTKILSQIKAPVFVRYCVVDKGDNTFSNKNNLQLFFFVKPIFHLADSD